MKKNKKNSVAGAVAVVTGFSVATRFLSFLFKVYISRALGAETVGLYQMALSVYLLTFSFAASGLPVVLSRKIAEDSAIGGKKTNGYLSAAIIICMSTAIFIVGAFYLFRRPFTALFADARAMELLLIMLPALISTSIYVSVRSWFWGQKLFSAFSFSEMLEEIFRIAFTLFLTSGVISVLTPVRGLAFGFLLSDIACVLVLAVLFLAYGGKLSKPSGYSELITSSAPITLMRVSGGMMTSLTALVIPAMLISSGGLTTPEATATFGRVSGMAMPLLMAPTTLTGALAVVLIPEIAAASAKCEKGVLRARVEGSIVFSLFIASFFCILFMPLGVEVAEIVFKDRLSGEFLSNSALLLYPIGLNQITLSMLNSLGQEKKSFTNYLFGAVFLAASLFILPAYIGVYAVAVGSGICFTLTSVLNMKILSKKVSLFDSMKKPVLTIILMPPCALLAFLLKMLLLPVLPKLIAVILAGGIPMTIYLFLAAAFKIIDVSRFYHRTKPRPCRR